MEKTAHSEALTRACSQCKFYDVFTDIQSHSHASICRRNAPSVTSVLAPVQRPDGVAMAWQHSTFWPMVNASDWCGEYQGKGGNAKAYFPGPRAA